MNFKFTLNLFFLMVLTSWGLTAQEMNTITITSPASVAGEYATNPTNDWGGVVTDGMTATLQLLNDNDASDSNTDDPAGSFQDGCNGTINPFSGTWAFMDRGDCGFSFKALNAQNAGAIGVVICNWRPDEVPPIMGSGPEADQVTIPVTSMTKEDCDILKTVITEEDFAMGTFSYIEPVIEPCLMDVVYGDEVVWGSNKEGEFDGGIGEWVNEAITGTGDWIHDADGVAEHNWAGWMALESETVCNGGMLFPYATYNTTGATQEYHEATLTSPSIDLTGADFPIVSFTQANLPLNNNANSNGGAGSYFQVSTDDGATWTDPFNITTENVLTATTTNVVGNEDVEIPIPEAAGMTNVKIRFGANGDYYHWFIDDVTIISVERFEVRANSDFAAGAQNFRTPVSQVEDLAFLMDVENTGNQTVDNVNLNLTVRDGIVAIHEDVLSYGDIAGGFLDENKAFPTTFEIPAEVGNAYSITYELSADNDTDDGNNQHIKRFEVTEDTYARVLPPEEYTGTYAAIAVPNVPYQSFGNYYHVANGEGYYVKDAKFGFGLDNTQTFTGIINFEMYEWLDLNGDGASTGDERLLIGFRDLPISNSLGQDYSNISMDLAAADGSDYIALGNDKSYMIMAHMNPFNPATDPIYRGNAIASDDEDYKYDYRAMTFARDTLGISPRYACFGGQGDDGSETDRQARELTPITNFTMYMPMVIGDIASLGTEDLNQEVKLTAYPNPAQDQLFVDFNLEGVSENVVIELVGINGQTALKTKLNNVQADRLELNTSNLTPGLYIMNVRTDFGINTQKVMIEK